VSEQVVTALQVVAGIGFGTFSGMAYACLIWHSAAATVRKRTLWPVALGLVLRLGFLAAAGGAVIAIGAHARFIVPAALAFIATHWLSVTLGAHWRTSSKPVQR
jgi:hypothetical protein